MNTINQAIIILLAYIIPILGLFLLTIIPEINKNKELQKELDQVTQAYEHELNKNRKRVN